MATISDLAEQGNVIAAAMGDEMDAEAALANLLWFLCDPEADDFGEPQETILNDAVAVADALGVHWRSGR